LKELITRTIARAGSAWNTFWFEADGVEQTRLFRRLFGLVFFVFVLSRTPDLHIFYMKGGIGVGELFKDAPDFQFRRSLLHFFTSPASVWALHLALLGSLLTLSFGIFPRASACVAWVLEMSFVNRNMAVSFGVDAISTFFLFYLVFADYRSRAGNAPKDWRATIGSVAFRLSQLQICIIYMYSGLDKVKGTTWWRGEAMWYVLSNPQLTRYDFSWVSQMPILLGVATYATLFWEIYFPALIWYRKARYPLLVFGVLLHVGIGTMMILPTFGMLMILTYSFFLKPEHAAWVNGFLRKPKFVPQVPVRAADESYV
jgi:hypothetical protein